MASPHLWISTALRDGLAPAGLGDFMPGELLAAANEQGVLPLLEWKLRSGGAWDSLPADFRYGLTDHSRREAAQSLFRAAELRRIASTLTQAGLQALLLKGNALAIWLYPQPYLRVSSDIDLLSASRAEADKAAAAFSAIGYALAFSPSQSNYEMTSRLIVDGVARSELDLHSRLLNSAAYAEVFSFDELWREAICLPEHEDGLRRLAPLHALAHACLNRALDMQIGVSDRLKLVYDIHLLLQEMDTSTWMSFIALAKQKRIAGICLRSIEDAIALFDSPVDPAAFAELQNLADVEPIDRRRLDDWRYMQWQNLRALPTVGARMRWLWGRLIPSPSHLRALHGEGSWLRLMWRRLGRAIRRVQN